MNSTRIWVKGKVVGEVKDGIFKKSVNSATGFLRQPPAIALSVESLEQADTLGAKVIEINARDIGAKYTVTISRFKQYAEFTQRGGYELQKFVPLAYWNVTYSEKPILHGSTESPSPDYGETVKPSAVQMDLFTGENANHL